MSNVAAYPAPGEGRPVIVFTEHRGVFFGYAGKTTDCDTVCLRDCRMAIYWGTTKGVFELAETGPTSTSKISAKADIEVRHVSAVMEVSNVAHEKWKEIK